MTEPPTPNFLEDDDDDLVALVKTGSFGGEKGPQLPIPDQRIVAALRLVDHSGICEQISSWRTSDATERHAGGRPTLIPDRAILAILVELGVLNEAQLASKATEAINHRISLNALALLGVSPGLVSSSAVWRAVKRLLDVIDPYPISRYRTTAKTEYLAALALLDAGVTAIKRHGLTGSATN